MGKVAVLRFGILFGLFRVDMLPYCLTGLPGLFE